MNTQTRNQKGFTLVELLIVVIILGILAAVVIPQFNNAASESKESALVANLATVRQAIEMYKVQHNDDFPATAGLADLTTATDVDGTVNAATGAYGPYLRNNFPKNPITGDNAITITTGVSALSAPSADGGWMYNSTTGEFRAEILSTTLAQDGTTALWTL